MVQAAAVYKMLAREPFQPVRVVLKNNLSYDVRSRQMIVVGIDFLVIGFQTEGRPKGVCGSDICVPLENIARLEPIAAPVGPSN